MNYRSCVAAGENGVSCLKELAEQQCLQKKFRVTKTLRLTLEMARKLLNTIPHLKVIQLFRDPRAVVFSHHQTKWSPIKLTSRHKITNGARAICERMVKDVQTSHKLLKEFPGRFKVIQYEDFEHPLIAVQNIYDFVGMPFEEEILEYIENTTETASMVSHEKGHMDGNHPFTYREHMPWDAVTVISKYCKEAFDLLGYKTFYNERDFRDLSISAVPHLTFTLS